MKTLIHVTSDVDGDLAHALRSSLLLLNHEELPHEDVTVLPHRQAVRVVVPGSSLADDVREALEQGVTVTVGATCLDALGLPRETLTGVNIVPSGVSEVVRLQAAGYNYVKIP